MCGGGNVKNGTRRDTGTKRMPRRYLPLTFFDLELPGSLLCFHFSFIANLFLKGNRSPVGCATLMEVDLMEKCSELLRVLYTSPLLNLVTFASFDSIGS